MSDPAQLYEAILTGNATLAEEVTKAALEAGVSPTDLLGKQMIPAMDEVGKRFECNEYFVPELLIAARAMKVALQILTPRLTEAGAKAAGRVVIGTVQGDLHDIGKNLVASMLEGGGFHVVDLGGRARPAFRRGRAGEGGHDCRPLRTADDDDDPNEGRDRRPRRCRHPRQDEGDDRRAPITQQYADEIGADGYSDNAAAAVSLARSLAS